MSRRSLSRFAIAALAVAAVLPLGASKPVHEILVLLAQELGLGWKVERPETIFEHLTRLVPEFQGMSYKEIGLEGMKTSCLSR